MVGEAGTDKKCLSQIKNFKNPSQKSEVGAPLAPPLHVGLSLVQA